MGKIIVIAGIPGTGKTTVCNLVGELAKKSGLKVVIANYGTITVETLKEHGKATDRDTMRKMDLKTQRQFQKIVAETIMKKTENTDSVTIIDTHMAIKTPSGYMPGMPRNVTDLLTPSLFVLVEAEAKEISTRRLKDSSRSRDEATESAVQEELLVSRLMGGACSVVTGASLKITINAEGKAEEAAAEILRAIGGL